MNKISLMGRGTGILKPQPASHIPADRAIRGTGKGTINTNPARKDCIAWTDRATGKLIYRTDYENEQYSKYKRGITDDTKAIPKEMFITTLWC